MAQMGRGGAAITPTLLGRWQTRLLLMGSLGLVITLGFAWYFADFTTPFVLIGYITLFGFGWDVLYAGLQMLRWERDWPPLFFFLSGLVEAVMLWGLINQNGLWAMLGRSTLPGVAPGLTFGQFAAHYSTVWLVTFLVMLGPLRVLSLRWRFYGGEWLGRPRG